MIYWLIEQVREGVLDSSHLQKIFKIVKKCATSKLTINLFEFSLQFFESDSLKLCQTLAATGTSLTA